MTKELAQVGCMAYGPNRFQIGRMDEDGCIRYLGTVAFRIENDAIFSMHDMYLGRLRNGTGRTDRGELLFTLRAEKSTK